MKPGRAAAGAWLAAAAVVAACFELSGPPSDLAAISRPILPWPSVVVDDSLRDSTGAAAPMLVEAFDGSGAVVTDAQVTFIPLDTGLRVTASGYVIGERVRTSPARVVAHVRRGGDVLQTPEISIDVVPRPDGVLPAGFDTLDVRIDTLIGLADTSRITSGSVAVTVFNQARRATDANAGGVRSWIVRYEITEDPAGVGDAPTAFFAGTRDLQVAADTTDPSGVAGRQVVLRTAVLPPTTRVGLHRVKVTVTVRERGQNVPGSPVEVVVPFEIRSAP